MGGGLDNGRNRRLSAGDGRDDGGDDDGRRQRGRRRERDGDLDDGHCKHDRCEWGTQWHKTSGCTVQRTDRVDDDCEQRHNAQ